MDRLELIESEWLKTVLDVVHDVTSVNPDDQFYAAAFCLCYVDYTMFGVPCFAMNTEAHVAAHGGNTAEGIRWSPPNWAFDVIDAAVARMQPFYEALSRDLAGKDESIWNSTIEKHFEALARVCRIAIHRLHALASESLTEDFVVGIFEEREGEPIFSLLVHSSIDAERLCRLPCPIWD